MKQRVQMLSVGLLGAKGTEVPRGLLTLLNISRSTLFLKLSWSVPE